MDDKSFLGNYTIFAAISAMPLSKSAWLGLLCSLTLAILGCSKPHPDRLGTTIAALSNLKFYLLPFSKGIIVHPLKLVAVKEKVFSPLCLDKAKATVCN